MGHWVAPWLHGLVVGWHDNTRGDLGGTQETRGKTQETRGQQDLETKQAIKANIFGGVQKLRKITKNDKKYKKIS